MEFCIATGEELIKLLSGSVGYLIFGKDKLIFVDEMHEKIKVLKNCEPEAKRLYIFFSKEFSIAEYLKENKVYKVIFGNEDKLIIESYPDKEEVLEAHGVLIPLS